MVAWAGPLLASQYPHAHETPTPLYQAGCTKAHVCTRPGSSVHRTPPSALAPRVRLCGERTAVWQDACAPWYALPGTTTRGASEWHGLGRAGGSGAGRPLLAWTPDPWRRGSGRVMHGTQFAQFSAEV